MNTENQISEHEENLQPSENSSTPQADRSADSETASSLEGTSDLLAGQETENLAPAQAEDAGTEADISSASGVQNTENVHESSAKEHETNEFDNLSAEQTIAALEKLVNADDAAKKEKTYNQLRDHLQKLMENEQHDGTEHLEAEHPYLNILSGLSSIYREKLHQYKQVQEAEQKKNLEEREAIIEKLKTLNSGGGSGSNLFKEIRAIKDEWSKAGQVPKADFKLLNNNYFHHLNQFYQMLDLNKEFLHQEYAHNLEKRRHIIDRAKELESEPLVQKALNELQYLHRLWKEEAEPVAEEHRETTWLEFKEISDRIHERRSELHAQNEAAHAENLQKKTAIINKIREAAKVEDSGSHRFWQDAIKNVEQLRDEFLKIGSVTRKESNNVWNDFKDALKQFNSGKNAYYKNLKNSQQHNLDEKNRMIAIARENMHSEDWETAVPLFKKLQEDWKQTGHVPRSAANETWDQFREACNTFFDNYRKKSGTGSDDWKENYRRKKEILDSLNSLSSDEATAERLTQLQSDWDAIGKVPRDKMNINREFSQTMRAKSGRESAPVRGFKDRRHQEDNTSDPMRKLNSQISDLQNEINTLENNLGFFSNSSRENPLLKDTYSKIDEKRSQLEQLKSQQKAAKSQTE